MRANHREHRGEASLWRFVATLGLVVSVIVMVAWEVTDYMSQRESSLIPVAPTPTAEATPFPDSSEVGPVIPAPTSSATATGKPPKVVKRTSILPEVISTAELGQRQVERLPRLRIGNGIQFPSPIDFNPATYAWDESSAKPGSSRGVVILTAHTYSRDQAALGNRLIATLDAGSSIEVIGDGQRQRYIVDSRRTYDLASYSELAGAWLDPAADAQLTLTVCDDYNPATGDWDSRVVWVATPMR